MKAEKFLIEYGYAEEDWGMLVESPMDFFEAIFHTSKALKEVDDMAQRVGDVLDLDKYEQARSALIEALSNMTELVNHYRKITDACLVAEKEEEIQEEEQQNQIEEEIPN